MDGAWLVRIRWRRRGAWLWPSFAALTVLDAVLGHDLPPTGESETVVAAAVMACFLNLIGVLLLRRPLGRVIRRIRGDLPVVVARDYAGTLAVVVVSIALLGAGAAHRPTLVAHARAMRDATARAQAWIGARAPRPFRSNLARITMFAIEPGSMYRGCVPSQADGRTYCVIVRTRLPFAHSVTFDGYEPNSVFAEGTG